MQAWVLDSNPGLLTKDKSDVALVMEKIGKIPMPLQSRDNMIAELEVLQAVLCFTLSCSIAPWSTSVQGSHLS